MERPFKYWPIRKPSEQYAFVRSTFPIFRFFFQLAALSFVNNLTTTSVFRQFPARYAAIRSTVPCMPARANIEAEGAGKANRM